MPSYAVLTTQQDPGYGFGNGRQLDGPNCNKYNIQGSTSDVLNKMAEDGWTVVGFAGADQPAELGNACFKFVLVHQASPSELRQLGRTGPCEN
eukprot:TRINITY_DN13160_c0_g1_i1.p2 TRINITY_DN13160_c0_g1~~TRINITY_DN13160_c0_g1_i1.p2  ORF type:complete len:102 (+),score=18.44 TRINITY_DN13160_c0_g1_i1:28-306(+)